MSEIGLLPVVVLVVGLAGGLLLSLLSGRAKSKRDDDADRELEITDLEAERDELYSQLRGDGSSQLSAADRAALELSAARVLRRLEELGGRPKPPKPEPASAVKEPPAESPPGVGFLTRHPLLAGAALGGGMVGIVALLIFWAIGDAQPDPNAPAPPPAAEQSGGFDRGEPQLSPQVAQRVASLRAQLSERPDDLETRRVLAELLLGHGQFFDAFQEAQTILAQDERDTLASYISGVVRYTMGQADGALEWLDRAIASDPTFTQASVVRGIILLQMNDREGAISSWQRGLDAVGGQDARLERLLEMARAGASAEEILSSP